MNKQVIPNTIPIIDETERKALTSGAKVNMALSSSILTPDSEEGFTGLAEKRSRIFPAPVAIRYDIV